MIISRLLPSRWLGSVAITIHSRAFSCFVSTARRFWISRRWETLIIEGDPAADGSCPLAIRFFYLPVANKQSIWMVHEFMCRELDELGEAGTSLDDAIQVVLQHLIRRELVTAERVFRPSTRN